MKIVIAAPLFPPEIGGSAPYVKELARRLATNHEVAVVTYCRLPENVPGTTIYTIDKRQALPARLLAYTRIFWNVAHDADVILAENGPSVELPSGLVAMFSRIPMIVHTGDERAHAHAADRRILRSIERFAMKRAKHIFEHRPLERPEILPFEPYPEEEFAAYEASWDEHIKKFTKLCNHEAA